MSKVNISLYAGTIFAVFPDKQKAADFMLEMLEAPEADLTETSVNVAAHGGMLVRPLPSRGSVFSYFLDTLSAGRVASRDGVSASKSPDGTVTVCHDGVDFYDFRTISEAADFATNLVSR